MPDKTISCKHYSYAFFVPFVCVLYMSHNRILKNKFLCNTFISISKELTCTCPKESKETVAFFSMQEAIMGN